MADRKSVPLLTLDTLIDRPVVVIAGKEYLLITNAMLPPLAAHRIQRLSMRIDELLKQDALTKEQEDELDGIPNQMCRIILEAPDAVQKKLTDRQRMDIIGTFVMAPMLMPGMVERLKTPIPVDPSIGASSSPDSSTGTEVSH